MCEANIPFHTPRRRRITLQNGDENEKYLVQNSQINPQIKTQQLLVVENEETHLQWWLSLSPARRRRTRNVTEGRRGVRAGFRKQIDVCDVLGQRNLTSGISSVNVI